MRLFKQIFFVLAVSLFLISPSANAEKTDFIDKQFDFKSIKAVYIYDVGLDVLNDSKANTSTKGSDLVNKVLKQDYVDNAKKFKAYTFYSPEEATRKISLLTGTDVDKMLVEDKAAGDKFLTDNLKLIADAYVTADLLAYYDDYYIVPAHTEWRSKTIYDDYYDKNGNRHTRSHTIQVPEYVPDQRVNTANVKMRFTLVDAKTGKEIFIREETRCNTFTTNIQECFRQTVRSFFRDLKNKIKD